MIYTIQNPDELKRAFSYAERLLSEKGKCHITVQYKKPKRSIQQNNYYWGVVLSMMCSESGYTASELHEILKGEILGYKEIEFNDRKHLIPKSTTKLTTSEMEDYLEHCRRIGAEHYDILIPLPNECIDDEYKISR